MRNRPTSSPWPATQPEETREPQLHCASWPHTERPVTGLKTLILLCRCAVVLVSDLIAQSKCARYEQVSRRLRYRIRGTYLGHHLSSPPRHSNRGDEAIWEAIVRVFGQSTMTDSSHAFFAYRSAPDDVGLGQRDPRRTAGSRGVREMHRRRESCATPPICPGPHSPRREPIVQVRRASFATGQEQIGNDRGNLQHALALSITQLLPIGPVGAEAGTGLHATSNTSSRLVSSHAFLTMEPNLWPRPGQLRPTTPNLSNLIAQPQLQTANPAVGSAPFTQSAYLTTGITTPLSRSHSNAPKASSRRLLCRLAYPHGCLPSLFNNDLVASSYFSCALHELEVSPWRFWSFTTGLSSSTALPCSA
ncbi:hypothetical protein CSUB01_03596 [Colletotrichum sublineola]|uniref:Uncharacterized protein n=1 Tax=Colletotrichum sublineola TaxID=1173701 RepID=A0A066XD53_COLSU|nr:hypothetical protein CSUB01_03596 [Colletotrichum sublineola]